MYAMGFSYDRVPMVRHGAHALHRQDEEVFGALGRMRFSELGFRNWLSLKIPQE